VRNTQLSDTFLLFQSTTVAGTKCPSFPDTARTLICGWNKVPDRRLFECRLGKHFSMLFLQIIYFIGFLAPSDEIEESCRLCSY